MLLFRSEEHVDRWGRTWKMDRGASLSPEQTWRLAYAWYSPDRRDPSWRRRTVDETESLLASIGLTDPYWSLR
ncbi:MAG: hypothetical protein QOK37_1159 [Thermoanaerobaculia bacterium]|jgi:hypothetical protein|nr:hypothetical protein [Thermoanaerobaculia bacterium]